MLDIRRATVGDAEALADLATRSFIAAYEPKLPGDDLDRFARATFSVSNIREELSSATSTVLMGYDEGRLVGYAMLREADVPAGVTRRRAWELARIYLEADAIGRGYGGALMQACLEEAKARGYGTLWLGVWEHNDRAIGFYERWGFSVVGSQQFEFAGALQTDLVMMRSVQNTEAG